MAPAPHLVLQTMLPHLAVDTPVVSDYAYELSLVSGVTWLNKLSSLLVRTGYEQETRVKYNVLNFVIKAVIITNIVIVVNRTVHTKTTSLLFLLVSKLLGVVQCLSFFECMHGPTRCNWSKILD